MKTNSEPFNSRDLEAAVSQLQLLKFFQNDPSFKASVMRLLAKMCPHKQALEFLVSVLVDQVGEWPGPKEVRGILCSRFEPADGIDAWCETTAGFTGSDGEAKSAGLIEPWDQKQIPEEFREQFKKLAARRPQ